MSLVKVAHLLSAHEMEADLGGAIVGRQIIVLNRVGSTNDALLEIAMPNFKEGLVLFAEHQTSGRGQRGNRWESAAGKGLWFSVLLRPRIELNKSSRLTTWATDFLTIRSRTEFTLFPYTSAV